ncbi:MAG TPA: diguanylate cyclase, partial [Anaerovoracaceae bacterium]|nr:diguanylate cyclase [Anaerovoracaceae bacterium]
IIAVCSIISYFYLISYKGIEDIYQNETQNTIIDLKRSFLKDTIANLIYEIDTSRAAEAASYKRFVDVRYQSLDFEKSLPDNEFMDFCIAKFSMDSVVEGDPYHWTVFLWNNRNRTALYDPDGLLEQDIPATLEKIKSTMLYYRMIDHGDISCLFGFRRDYIEDRVKASTLDRIKRLRFDNDSYIWVNEVLNYEGGKNYAIRLAHSSMPETEGTYLSTDMSDIKGNLPYLAELEGVKKDGELFFNYYFKELNSDKISEKLSYARLYQDYDWIVAMGVPTNEVEWYIDRTNEKSKEMTTKFVMRLVLLLIIVIASFLTFLMMIEKWHFGYTKKQLESEINMDPLTRAYSRKYGTRELMRAFGEFHMNGSSPVIMLVDIDNFKRINDSYGHDAGDRVLKEVVNAIYQSIRSSDKLIRWGGDEFVGIFYGSKEEDAAYFGDKILNTVSSLRIPAGDEILQPTLSVGISYFKDSDEDFSAVLKRADQAMYQSKKEGRNNANTL